MRRIFQKADDGLLTELPQDFDYTGRVHSLAIIEAAVLWSDAEIAQLKAHEAHEVEEQKAADAEREAQVQRRAAILGRLGLTDDEAAVLLTNAP